VKGNEFFITGTLSPVNIDSLTITDPVNKTISQGKILFCGIIIISPGRSYDESINSK
jgi:hypothetical protein